jgi:hypothetical protein
MFDFRHYFHRFGLRGLEHYCWTLSLMLQTPSLVVVVDGHPVIVDDSL